MLRSLGAIMSRRVRAITRLTVFAWVLAACAAPTLPLPPPELDAPWQPAVVELQPDRQSVRIAGDGALRTGDIDVVMLNEELGLARFVRPDLHGHYEGILPVDISCAQPTNHVVLWQRRFDGVESPSITVTVPRTLSMPPDAGCSDMPQDAAAAESGSDDAAGTRDAASD